MPVLIVLLVLLGVVLVGIAGWLDGRETERDLQERVRIEQAALRAQQHIQQLTATALHHMLQESRRGLQEQGRKQ